MKLSLLSSNLSIILGELINIQDVVKLIHYNDRYPLTQPDLVLPDTDLINTRVFPTPFYPNTTYNPEDPMGARTEIHIWFPRLRLTRNGVVGDIDINFDIICAKSLWLMGNNLVRPYEIADRINDHFDDKSILTVGTLIFNDVVHVSINPYFDMVRLIARMKTFND